MSVLVRGISGLAIVVATTCHAQAQNPPKDKPRPTTDTSSINEMSVDSILVNCLIKENENEIAVARYAQQHASNNNVQAFAEGMIKDHSAFVSKLRQFNSTYGSAKESASGAGIDGDRQNERDGDRKKDRDADRRPETRVDPKTDKGVNRDPTKGQNLRQHGNIFGTMTQIGEELSQQCLATTLRELREKQGAELDRCYMGGQIQAHLKMTDTLEVYQKHVSSDLRSLLATAESNTKEHLAHAKQMMKELESQSAKTTTSTK